MSKKANTLLGLEAALERIIQGNTKRISDTRKLSVRAVEEEANLGNGSCYYYPEFIEKIKKTKFDNAFKASVTATTDTEKLRARLKNETKIKEKYKQSESELKELVSVMAAEHHHLNDALRKTTLQVKNLEIEVSNLKESLAVAKRDSIKIIK